MDFYSPVFILSNPRSGSSLLRLMLNCHRNIVIPPECGYILWWHKKYGYWQYSEDLIYNFIEDLKKSRKIETWDLDFDELRKYLIHQKPDSYQKTCGYVSSFYALRLSKNLKLWGDKNNYYVNHIQDIECIFPKAYFIHLIRDGRDVAASYQEVNNLNTKSVYKPVLVNEITQIAEQWVKNNLNILGLQAVHPGKFLSVKFEDLILHTRQVLTNICTFLKIDFDEGMIQFHTMNRQWTMEPLETLDWKQKTLEETNQSTIGRYQKNLKSDEVTGFQNIAHGLLKKFNYKI